MTTPDTMTLSESMLAALRGLGGPADEVIAQLGLPTVPPRHVTTEQFFEFWRTVAALDRRPELGLLLGDGAPHRPASITSVALQAPDLAGALRTVARYKRLTCPEVVEVDLGEAEASVRFLWVLAVSEVPPLLVASSFAASAAMARVGTGGQVKPVRVELARRPAHAALFRAHFGCPVVFGAHTDRLVFARRDLDTPFVTADAEAFSRLVPGLEAQLRARSRLSTEVRVAIARCISRGEAPRVEHVARRLHLSARTLQRRLGEEETTWQQQLDLVRRATARRLLADTEFTPVDIAFFLGFEEPNSFVRAFRAWERTTPIRWRERTLAS